MICYRSVVLSGFFHQYNWSPWYKWYIVDSGTKHHNTNPYPSNYECLFSPLCENVNDKQTNRLQLIRYSLTLMCMYETSHILKCLYQSYGSQSSYICVIWMSIFHLFNDFPIGIYNFSDFVVCFVFYCIWQF